jgi:hypothetical protein
MIFMNDEGAGSPVKYSRIGYVGCARKHKRKRQCDNIVIAYMMENRLAMEISIYYIHL